MLANFGLHTAGKTAIAIVSALLLSGCPEEKSPRNCPGFNHPAVSDWLISDVGQTMRFADAEGSLVVYELLSVDSSGPETQYGTGDVVACIDSSLLTFSTPSTDQQMVFEFRQVRRDEPVEQSSLSLGIVLKQAEELDSVPLHRIYVSEPEYERNNLELSNTSTTQFTPVGIVNGVQYQTVISSMRNVDDTQLASTDVDTDVALKRVVFAKEFGLVQVGLQSGTELNRLD